MRALDAGVCFIAVALGRPGCVLVAGWGAGMMMMMNLVKLGEAGRAD